ncbi:MAG: STAS domain-containing protein [Acidimicrobiia bacterium]
MNLTLEVKDRDGIGILEVSGEVDLYTVPQLREALTEMAQRWKRFAVDLDGVSFIDSTGLGVLVGGLKRARDGGGDLELICSQAQILRVFEITGLTSVFSIHASSEGAVEATPPR